MPNYVKNKVIVDHEDLASIADFMEGEDGAFDFNNLVPMPDELKGIQCMHSGEGEVFYRLEDLEKAEVKDLAFADFTGDFPVPRVPTLEWVQENRLDELTVRRLLKEYGAAYWYDWCVDNWGTKWPASEVDTKVVANRLVFNFFTAWDPPFPIISKFIEHAKKTGGRVEWQFQYEEDYAKEDYVHGHKATTHTIRSEDLK